MVNAADGETACIQRMQYTAWCTHPIKASAASLMPFCALHSGEQNAASKRLQPYWQRRPVDQMKSLQRTRRNNIGLHLCCIGLGYQANKDAELGTLQQLTRKQPAKSSRVPLLTHGAQAPLGRITMSRASKASTGTERCARVQMANRRGATRAHIGCDAAPAALRDRCLGCQRRCCCCLQQRRQRPCRSESWRGCVAFQRARRGAAAVAAAASGGAGAPTGRCAGTAAQR